MIDKTLLQKESTLLTNIKIWNVKFPFDLTWRRKYNIPFGSKEHKGMCLFDIKFDVEEGVLIEKIVAENIIERKNKELGKIDKQLFKNKVSKQMQKEEIDAAFSDLNLDDFDNIKI